MSSPTVLVGFNDSDASVAALAWAAQEAVRLEAQLEVLWVLPSSVAWEMAVIQVDSEKRRRQMLERAQLVCRRLFEGTRVRYRVQVREGSPTRTLIHEAARLGATRLVVGATHRGAVGDLVMGSVVHDLVHRAAIPVVVVPPTARADVEAAGRELEPLLS